MYVLESSKEAKTHTTPFLSSSESKVSPKHIWVLGCKEIAQTAYSSNPVWLIYLLFLFQYGKQSDISR